MISFFTEKCVPSLVASLEKISSTSAETASTRGIKIHLCPVAGKKSQIRTRARRKSYHHVFSSFAIKFGRTPHGMTLSVQLRGQEEEMILWWTELCHSTRLHSLDTVLSQMMRSQIMDNGICHTDVQQAIPCTCQKRT